MWSLHFILHVLQHRIKKAEYLLAHMYCILLSRLMKALNIVTCTKRDARLTQI